MYADADDEGSLVHRWNAARDSVDTEPPPTTKGLRYLILATRRGSWVCVCLNLQKIKGWSSSAPPPPRSKGRLPLITERSQPSDSRGLEQ